MISDLESLSKRATGGLGIRKEVRLRRGIPIAIGLLIVVEFGMKLLGSGSKEAKEMMRRLASRRKGRWELSLVSTMISLLKEDKGLIEHLSTHTKLNLEAHLPNVS
jgi:hypothetical protein